MRLSEILKRLRSLREQAEMDGKMATHNQRHIENAEALRLAVEMLDSAATKALLT